MRHSNDARIGRLEDRLNTIDMTGTRGVAVLAVQVQELTSQLAKHERDHENEEAARGVNRRWLLGTVAAAAAANAGTLVTLLVTHLH